MKIADVVLDALVFDATSLFPQVRDESSGITYSGDSDGFFFYPTKLGRSPQTVRNWDMGDTEDNLREMRDRDAMNYWDYRILLMRYRTIATFITTGHVPCNLDIQVALTRM